MKVFPRLHPRLQSAISRRLGWQTLREVQDLAGHALLNGDNAIVLAPTAGGKTEASIFPTLSILLHDPPEAVGALYIAPIKALLNNQEDRLGTYTEMVGLERFVWHGDVGTSARNRFLKAPAEILMTTPESLEVMLISTKVDVTRLFADLRVVIIDEVHALAGTDRGAHMMSVLERLAQLSRHDVQRVGLSATVGNPQAIGAWLQGSSTRGSQVIDPPHATAKRSIQVRHHEELNALAHVAARLGDGRKSLFFCESRKTSEAVASAMAAFGTTVWVHHSSVSAEERRIAEDAFHKGSDVCIACTSTLELGIDVGDLDRVLQHEAPGTVSSFMQRMGRTGRRKGAVANTTFLCQSEEAIWVSLALVRLARQGWVEDVGVLRRCWPIMVHQLLAMALADNGVAPDVAWTHFRRVPDVRDITRAEFERLVAWLVRQTALQLIAGRLVIGHKAEQRFGKRNFLDLYAVFESPASYGVETLRGGPLGSLEQSFVDRLVEGSSVFRLGGRGWMVKAVDHRKRVVKVSPAGGGKAPTWSGFGARLLGQRLCAEVEALLRDNNAPNAAHATALDVLVESRERFAPVFERDNLEWSDKGLTWWTFAGGRINTTLARAFAAVEPGWKVVTGNFSVRFEGNDVTEGSWHAALLRISDVEFWEDAQLWHEIGRALPNYRLSKFQQFMPPWVAREMVASFLLDIEGTALWLIDKHVNAPDWVPLEPPATEAISVGMPQREARRLPPVDNAAQPENPVTWVATADALQAACDTLSAAARVGLDVETTLTDQALCLVQMATSTHTWLIDPLAIEDLTPLAELLANADVAKVIHNASFEKRVLGRYDMPILNIVDTLKLSREVRAVRGKGEHTLATVCQRELGLAIDKECQTSDWRRRPLTADQVRYAALDAEILLRVLDALPEPPQGTLFG